VFIIVHMVFHSNILCQQPILEYITEQGNKMLPASPGLLCYVAPCKEERAKFLGILEAVTVLQPKMCAQSLRFRVDSIQIHFQIFVITLFQLVAFCKNEVRAKSMIAESYY